MRITRRGERQPWVFGQQSAVPAEPGRARARARPALTRRAHLTLLGARPLRVRFFPPDFEHPAFICTFVVRAAPL